jgi:hydroxypyruvate isomerase
MNSQTLVTRRTVLGSAGVAATGAMAASLLAAADEPAKVKGNMKQSICRWCYGRIPLDKLAEEALKIGYKSIELLVPDEIVKILPMGLTCAVIGGADIANGLNRVVNHDRIVDRLHRFIEFAAEHKIPNVITMSGNRKSKNDSIDMSDEEGWANCVKGLKRIVGFAEEKKVTIVMEGLNSKVNHKDYMYDKTPWGVELCKKVGSERFKLLYDIYHMQIMEGDVIATIRQYKDYIAHYHTGGVPGRNEIDETQELNYPAIIRAILDTGYKGYLGQEYIPKRDPLASLAQGFRICDV